MAKKRHYTPQELCMMAKNVARNKQVADKSPFTTCCIFGLYSLWKGEGWGTKRLTRYIPIMRKHYDYLSDHDKDKFAEYNKIIKDKADFDVTYVDFTEEDIPKDIKKGSFLYQLEMKQAEANNAVNEFATHYMPAHFVALIELKMSANKLIKNRDMINQYFDEGYDNDDLCLNMHKELEDKLGLYVEFAKI